MAGNEGEVVFAAGGPAVVVRGTDVLDADEVTGSVLLVLVGTGPLVGAGVIVGSTVVVVASVLGGTVEGSAGGAGLVALGGSDEV